MFTYVAVPFQIKELTNSYVAVAMSGLIEIVPLVIFGLYGGVLADAIDRKKLIWITEALSLLFNGPSFDQLADGLPQHYFDLCSLWIIRSRERTAPTRNVCGPAQIS